MEKQKINYVTAKNKNIFIYISLIVFVLTFWSSLYIFFNIFVILSLMFGILKLLIKRKYNIKANITLVLLLVSTLGYHQIYNSKIKSELLNEKKTILFKNKELSKKEIEDLYKKNIIYIKSDNGFILMKKGIDFNTFILEKNSSEVIENKD